MREDTRLVKIFLDKSLIIKTQIGFINENIEKTKESLKINVRQSSIIDPFDVISNTDIHNSNFNISFPKHIVTTNLISYKHNRKDDLYTAIESEMFCNLSIVLFDNLIGYLNYVIKLCNKFNYNDIDIALEDYQSKILSDKMEDIFCHTIFMKKKIGHLQDKLMPNECFGIIDKLFKSEFRLFNQTMKKNLSGINCVDFFMKMEKFREYIVYHNSVLPKSLQEDIQFYSYKNIEDSDSIRLSLDRNGIENLIEIYNQSIYIVYKALITKYKLENEIKNETISYYEEIMMY